MIGDLENHRGRGGPNPNYLANESDADAVEVMPVEVH